LTFAIPSLSPAAASSTGINAVSPFTGESSGLRGRRSAPVRRFRSQQNDPVGHQCRPLSGRWRVLSFSQTALPPGPHSKAHLGSGKCGGWNCSLWPGPPSYKTGSANMHASEHPDANTSVSHSTRAR
jgi:hypothetical protein